jgi:hypothetical protein
MNMTWRRFLVRMKQNQRLITAGGSVLALVIFFQNCGTSTPSDSSAGLGGNGSTPTWVTASVTSFNFTSAIGSSDLVITFTASRPASSLALTQAFPGGGFTVLTNTCNATSLGANSSCTVTVHYHNCTTASKQGYLALGYTDPVTNEQGTAVVVTLTGVAGSPSACSVINNSNTLPPPGE